ncbi:hypothetical protein BGY98DRAFT_570516 [Russula aff. rugulosa BPL654]|nr:hypothetical protein BGY98DRAFT_570516 [Russula aff. rugulosa BPL654]
MPTCPHPTCPCAHRNIAAEALLNHVQSSPWASLYICATCKCVCKSETVLHHHKQKVHGIDFAATSKATSVPQAVPVQLPRPSSSAACYCHVCNRPYNTTSALEQHYRDTPIHPKCTRCNIGFVDSAAVQAVSTLISVSYLGRVINMSTWAKARRLRPSSNCLDCSGCLDCHHLPYLC